MSPRALMLFGVYFHVGFGAFAASMWAFDHSQSFQAAAAGFHAGCLMWILVGPWWALERAVEVGKECPFIQVDWKGDGK